METKKAKDLEEGDVVSAMDYSKKEVKDVYKLPNQKSRIVFFKDGATRTYAKSKPLTYYPTTTQEEDSTMKVSANAVEVGDVVKGKGEVTGKSCIKDVISLTFDDEVVESYNAGFTLTLEDSTMDYNTSINISDDSNDEVEFQELELLDVFRHCGELYIKTGTEAAVQLDIRKSVSFYSDAKVKAEEVEIEMSVK